MKLRHIGVVYRKELRDLLRDKRTLRSMVLVPIILMPLLTVGLSRAARTIRAQAMSETPVVALLGGEDSPALTARLRADRKLRVVTAPPDWKLRIAEKKLAAAVRIPAGFDGALAQGAAGTVTIYEFQGELRSGLAAGELEGFFRRLSESTVRERLAARGVPADALRTFATQRQNAAPPEKVAGNRIGGLVPYFIIIVSFIGALYPAIDLTAGEKERGTIETLLCTPLARTEIVLGKFFMVLTCSLAAVVLACVSLVLSFQLPAAQAGGIADLGLTHVDPAGAVGVLTLVLPAAVLFSALMVAIGLWARNHREAQSYLQPMMFVVIIPAVIGLFPGIELNAKLALIPILNLSLACREMLSGVWHWHYLILIYGSMCLYAVAALALAVRMFNRESVLFRT